MFPWIVQLGLGDSLINAIINEGLQPTGVVSWVRQQSQWQNMFPNIRRDDGTMRTNESQYLQTLDNYRQTLTAWGVDTSVYDNEMLSLWMRDEVDVNELNQRFQTYDTVRRAGPDVMAAFYVYGGLSLSTDDLYNAVIDPNVAPDLIREYETGAASGLDYPTFIGRVVDIVSQTTGASVDRTTAAALLDQLSHGGDPFNGGYLSLAELTNAFDASMIGSTATAQGLALPTIDRIQEFRTAGITRTAALQQYGQFARDQNFLNAAITRSSGQSFDQSDFESASFLSDPNEQRRLQRGLAQEASRSKAGGAFSFGREDGRLQQAGLSALRN